MLGNGEKKNKKRNQKTINLVLKAIFLKFILKGNYLRWFPRFGPLSSYKKVSLPFGPFL